jgi:hypothetical protein
MQPSPPLSWMLNPAYLTPVQQCIAVLELLRSMCMSPMDLLVTSLGSDPAYKTYQDGFYRGSGLDHFLNTVEANKRGSKRLREWMKHRAISMVLEIVDNEVNELRDEFQMSVEQVTPSFLLNFNLKKQVV